MPDREKVIRIIDELIFKAQKAQTWKAENALRCLKKELLKEQEGVKPFIQISEHTGRKWLTCGACENPIASEKDSWGEINFCPKCGKAVKWE